MILTMMMILIPSLINFKGGNSGGKRHYAGDPRYRNSVKGIYKGLG